MRDFLRRVKRESLPPCVDWYAVLSGALFVVWSLALLLWGVAAHAQTASGNWRVIPPSTAYTWPDNGGALGVCNSSPASVLPDGTCSFFTAANVSDGRTPDTSPADNSGQVYIVCGAEIDVGNPTACSSSSGLAVFAVPGAGGGGVSAGVGPALPPGGVSVSPTGFGASVPAIHPNWMHVALLVFGVLVLAVIFH